MIKNIPGSTFASTWIAVTISAWKEKKMSTSIGSNVRLLSQQTYLCHIPLNTSLNQILNMTYFTPRYSLIFILNATAKTTTTTTLTHLFSIFYFFFWNQNFLFILYSQSVLWSLTVSAFFFLSFTVINTHTFTQKKEKKCAWIYWSVEKYNDWKRVREQGHTSSIQKFSQIPLLSWKWSYTLVTLDTHHLKFSAKHKDRKISVQREICERLVRDLCFKDFFVVVVEIHKRFCEKCWV